MKIITRSVKKKYFIEDIKIGLIKKFKVKISKKLHNDFSNFSGDKSLLHQNKKFCSKNNFKSIVGYGFLITSILSKIYGIYFPGGTELCLRQECNFKKPYYINDVLHFQLKVTHINKINKLLSIETKVFRNLKQLIFQGNSLLQLSLDKTL
jgi:3-hydroxybutyryl-CoA dehydratase